MSHYACTGSCKGANSQPGLCEAQFCSKEGQSLISCNCEDGMHENAGSKTVDEDTGLPIPE